MGGRKMKKRLSVLLVAVLACTLSGCFLASIKQDKADESFKETGDIRRTVVYTFAENSISQTGTDPIETTRVHRTTKTTASTIRPTLPAVTTLRKTEPVLKQTTSSAIAPIGITLVDITSPIGRNETATITIKGEPNTRYSIAVFYSSSESSAAGLEEHVSDSNGFVKWSWKIGGRTKAGEHSIVISGGGQRFETRIRTTE